MPTDNCSCQAHPRSFSVYFYSEDFPVGRVSKSSTITALSSIWFKSINKTDFVWQIKAKHYSVIQLHCNAHGNNIM